MKRLFICMAAAMLGLSAAGQAQTSPKAVMMGDSITEMWLGTRPEFFSSNNFSGKGISGQVTAQMLERFNNDVIAAEPQAVSILGGINDIAQNKGYVSEKDIYANIREMAKQADKAGIKVILCSILPANVIPWKKEIKPEGMVQKVNAMTKTLARRKGYVYIDYWSALVDAETLGLKAELTLDGVHVNAACYEIMEKMYLEALDKALAPKKRGR